MHARTLLGLLQEPQSGVSQSGGWQANTRPTLRANTNRAPSLAIACFLKKIFAARRTRKLDWNTWLWMNLIKWLHASTRPQKRYTSHRGTVLTIIDVINHSDINMHSIITQVNKYTHTQTLVNLGLLVRRMLNCSSLLWLLHSALYPTVIWRQYVDYRRNQQSFVCNNNIGEKRSTWR